MTDNEKRAHDLAIACIPNIMKENEWNYYCYNDNNEGYVNPDIANTYVEFYSVFLDEFKGQL